METSRPKLPSINSLLLRTSPAMSSMSSSLPPPPTSGQDGNLQSWLQAKSEEDRRAQEEAKMRQEEEKTQQETLRLEQRKLELEILKEAGKQGVPPDMIPFIFTGINGNINRQWITAADQHSSHTRQNFFTEINGNNNFQPAATAGPQNYPSFTGISGSNSIRSTTPAVPQPELYTHQAFHRGIDGNKDFQSTATTALQQQTHTNQHMGSLFGVFRPNEHMYRRADQFHQQPASIDFHHYIPPRHQSPARSTTTK